MSDYPDYPIATVLSYENDLEMYAAKTYIENGYHVGKTR